MDRTKEELLGTIQQLASRRRQLAADYKGQRDALAEIEADLPAKKDLADLASKVASAGARLKEQRKNSDEWTTQNEAVLEAKATLSTIEESLSEALIHYMVKTKKKAVHAFASDEASVDREIVMAAKIGQKVAANLSIFDEDND